MICVNQSICHINNCEYTSFSVVGSVLRRWSSSELGVPTVIVAKPFLWTRVYGSTIADARGGSCVPQGPFRLGRVKVGVTRGIVQLFFVLNSKGSPEEIIGHNIVIMCLHVHADQVRRTSLARCRVVIFTARICHAMHIGTSIGTRDGASS